jgi:guanine deaminase
VISVQAIVLSLESLQIRRNHNSLKSLSFFFSPALKGATMYTSCEPCPMCYSTAYWARISKIYYAAAWTDYSDLFDDSNISMDMKKPYAERAVPVEPLMRNEAQKVWLEFRKMPDGAKY